MTLLGALALAIAGFALLALAMGRHQYDTLGRRLSVRVAHQLRLGAAVLLSGSYASAIGAWGWARGSVGATWMIVPAALVCVLTLLWRPRALRAVGLAGAFVGAVSCLHAAVMG